jgi:hypothetical protein
MKYQNCVKTDRKQSIPFLNIFVVFLSPCCPWGIKHSVIQTFQSGLPEVYVALFGSSDHLALQTYKTLTNQKVLIVFPLGAYQLYTTSSPEKNNPTY